MLAILAIIGNVSCPLPMADAYTRQVRAFREDHPRTFSIHVPDLKARNLLIPNQLIASPETGLRYRIERLLGAGRLRPGLSRHAARPLADGARDGLHQGQRAHRRLAARGLLRPAARRPSARDPRLRRVPADARRTARVLYCLALEYARHGDLSAFLAAHRQARGRRRGARREIAGILQVLGKLHRGQLLHRDLTPLNVFVCDGRTPQARRLRHRPAAERPARHHRAHDERADGAERHPRRRRAEVAGARRRLSGRAAAGDAGQGRRARADPHARGPRAWRAAIT